ncbi:sodium/hydrogen exchanger 7-like [Ixodes scapularis]
MKKVQRSIRFPYTVFIFIVGLGISFNDVGLKRQGTLSAWFHNINFHILMTFVPAATVYATQGINHIILRRCAKETMVFSVGTLGMSTAVSALYAFSFLETKNVRNSVLFGILLCTVERVPVADELFKEGRYPVLTTMLQAETIVNNLVVWSFLRQMASKVITLPGAKKQIRKLRESIQYKRKAFNTLVALERLFLGLRDTTPRTVVIQVVNKVCRQAYVIPRRRVMEAIEIFISPPSFLYQIWHFIANIFGVLILQTQPKYQVSERTTTQHKRKPSVALAGLLTGLHESIKYAQRLLSVYTRSRISGFENTCLKSPYRTQTWPLDKIKLRLSSLLLPDLSAAHDFHRSPDIEDIVLVQGSLVDVNCGDLYVAPAYIPRSVKRFIFPGDFSSRPRPVVIVVANKHYSLPLEFDWLKKMPTEEERLAEVEASKQGFGMCRWITVHPRNRGSRCTSTEQALVALLSCAKYVRIREVVAPPLRTMRMQTILS